MLYLPHEKEEQNSLRKSSAGKIVEIIWGEFLCVEKLYNCHLGKTDVE